MCVGSDGGSVDDGSSCGLVPVAAGCGSAVDPGGRMWSVVWNGTASVGCDTGAISTISRFPTNGCDGEGVVTTGTDFPSRAFVCPCSPFIAR